MNYFLKQWRTVCHSDEGGIALQEQLLRFLLRRNEKKNKYFYAGVLHSLSFRRRRNHITKAIIVMRLASDSRASLEQAKQ
jgi:hypothetical protein